MMALLLAVALQSPLGVEAVPVEDGPTLHVHHQAGPLIALRLSVPVPVDLPEGSVELLQELVRPSADDAARPHAARVEWSHEGGRAVVAVTGPRAAFDAMVAILRRATGEPDLSLGSLPQARARAENRVLARLEQPGPRIRRLLRHRLYGGPEPVGAAAGLYGPEGVRRLRDRLYVRDSMRVVLVGDVPPVVVRSAFGAWPGGNGGSVEPPRGEAEIARPQAHREWAGLAFPVDVDPAVLAVTAQLIQERAGTSTLAYVAVEFWTRAPEALVLVGAALPGDSLVRATATISDLAVRDSAGAPDVGYSLRRLVAEASALTGSNAVARSRDAVRRRHLLEARTVAGKAALIDRAAELDPEGDLDRYLARLARVDLQDVRALLTRILDTPAVVAEGQ